MTVAGLRLDVLTERGTWRRWRFLIEQAGNHCLGRNPTIGSDASRSIGEAEPVERAAPIAGRTLGTSLASQGWRRQNSAAASVASSGPRSRCSGV